MSTEPRQPLQGSDCQSVPFTQLPVIQQAELYAWYVNLSRTEQRRVDALDDDTFEAAYRSRHPKEETP